jgi:hypothetical protein
MIYPIIKKSWSKPPIDCGWLALITLLVILAFGFLFGILAASAEEISEGARQQLAQQPHALVRGDSAVSNAYGVPVTQEDIDLQGVVGICELYKGDLSHPPDPSFWPDLVPGAPANQPPGPCTKLNQKYEQSGAKAKYNQAYAKKRAEQFNAIMKTLGNQ